MDKNRIIILLTILLLTHITILGHNIMVKPGIEVLKENNFDILKGKRVGLITNPTGVDCNLKSTIDILYEAEEVILVELYGP